VLFETLLAGKVFFTALADPVTVRVVPVLLISLIIHEVPITTIAVSHPSYGKGCGCKMAHHPTRPYKSGHMNIFGKCKQKFTDEAPVTFTLAIEMVLRTTWILLYLAFLHLVGIYLFTRGFLLSRLSLSTRASCSISDHPCALPPTHNRAVFLIIDALRFDFLSPHPPDPHSPYHHNVLTLPRELTAEQPRNSFLFNAHADPPTTTLQRIKGLVTGSLPTFVDMGHNFGGTSIAEDSIILQLQQANKTVRTSNTTMVSSDNPFLFCR
jgi:hypothetical protein